MAIVEGKKPPHFTLSDAAGKSVSLDDFKGRHVIVYFYPRTTRPAAPRKPVAFAICGRSCSAPGS
jgi:peroxiredoxin Q/BCP